MKKYIEVIKVYFKVQLAWRTDCLLDMLFSIGRILFAYLLWSIIYDGKELISGFTFNAMLSYYIISAFLSQIEMSEKISWKMSGDIRKGAFSKYMVIPANIEGYFTAMEVGSISFNVLLGAISAIVWTLIFGIDIVFTTNVVIIICSVIIILLGLWFMTMFSFFLGLLTLKFKEISTFLMIKNNLMALITGTVIPLVLLPEGFVNALRILPFYYVTYLPSMLLTGRCQGEMVSGLVILLLWCIVMKLVNAFVYKRYRVSYDAAGI